MFGLPGFQEKLISRKPFFFRIYLTYFNQSKIFFKSYNQMENNPELVDIFMLS